MKIAMDKNYTRVGQVEKIREDMKQFKGAYTDNDLRRAFEEATDRDLTGEILKTTVSAFSGTFETSYAVEMIIDADFAFKRVSFYCNGELKVDTEPLLIGYRVYKPA